MVDGTFSRNSPGPAHPDHIDKCVDVKTELLYSTEVLLPRIPFYDDEDSLREKREDLA